LSNHFKRKRGNITMEEFTEGIKTELENDATRSCPIKNDRKRDENTKCAVRLAEFYVKTEFSDTDDEEITELENDAAFYVKTEMKFTCQKCEYKSSKKSHFDRHTTEVHDKLFKCNLCNFIGNKRQALQEHKSSSHEKHFKKRVRSMEASHICNICAKRYMTSIGLKHHIMSHTGERPFQCDKCSSSFKAANALKRHQFVHSGSRDFKCDQCPKSFLSQQTLYAHSMTHGEKLHVCNYCQKRFFQLGNCKAHERLHTGERPYICDVCEKTFVQLSNLNSHKEKASHWTNEPTELKRVSVENSDKDQVEIDPSKLS